MKKTILISALLLFGFLSFAQYPATKKTRVQLNAMLWGKRAVPSPTDVSYSWLSFYNYKDDSFATISNAMTYTATVLGTDTAIVKQGSIWRKCLVSNFASPGWSLTGNALTGTEHSPTEFFGSTNNFDVVFKENNTEIIRLYNGFVGIAQPVPTARLHTLGIGNTTATNTVEFHNSTGVNNGFLLRDDGHVAMGTATFGATSRLKVETTESIAIFANNVATSGDGYGGYMTSTASSSGTNYGVAGIASGGATNKAIATFANNPGASANNWSLYSDAQAQSYFNGSVGVGIAVPTSKFHVKGTGATVATTDLLIENSASTPGFEVKGNGMCIVNQYGKMMATGSLNILYFLTSTTPDFGAGNRNTLLGNNDTGIPSSTGAQNMLAGNFGLIQVTGDYNTVLSARQITTPTSGASNILIGAGGLTNTTRSSCLTLNGFADNNNEAVFGNPTFGRYDSWWFGQGKQITTASGRYTLSWYATSITAGETNQAAVGDWIFNASAGTGTGAGGDFIWKVAPAAATGTVVNTLTEKVRITSQGNLVLSGRMQEKQGADIASASTIACGFDGNTFELTGTTAVTLITSTGWQNGSTITLVANENVTITNGTASSGADITIKLAGSANFSMTANDMLTLKLCETTAGGQAWREVSRTVI